MNAGSDITRKKSDIYARWEIGNSNRQCSIICYDCLKSTTVKHNSSRLLSGGPGEGGHEEKHENKVDFVLSRKTSKKHRFTMSITRWHVFVICGRVLLALYCTTNIAESSCWHCAPINSNIFSHADYLESRGAQSVEREGNGDGVPGGK